MKYPAYPKYKDSGVEWLKTIPYDWESTKLKYVSDFQTGWTPPTANKESYEGDDCWATIGDLGSRVIYDTENRISKKAILDQNIPIVSKGSLLFSFKLSIGQVSFAGIDLFTNEAIAAFTQNNNIDLGFAYYLFPVSIVKNATNNIYGAKLLNQFLIKNSYLPLPPLSTQKAIATFLDNETVKIDGLIKDYEELITLLQEKRQALISHAVTRGLSELVSPDDPEFGEWAKPVKFKDSGVEWLGEIPEEWTVTKSKYVCKCNPEVLDDTTDKDQSISYIEISDVQFGSGVLNHTELAFGSAPSRARRIVKTNDIIISTVRTYLKAIAQIDQDKNTFIVSTGFAVLRPINIQARYLHYVFHAQGLHDVIINKSVGVSYPAINASDLVSIHIPLPSLCEQQSIAAYLGKETSKVDSLLSETESAISLLKEHRSALITNAVTGKINVEALV